LGRYEGMEAVGGDIQVPKPEHGVQQMHDGRQDNESMRSGGPTIQRSRVGKQYESFNDKGGLNEPDYEAITRGIERAKRDRQDRVAYHYRTAQEEHERRRAEARSRIEANQRTIEQVRTENQELKSLLKSCLNELE